MEIIFLIFSLAVGRVAEAGEGEMSIARTMYDNMARLVGEEEYPATWWEEREQCLALISPSLADRQTSPHQRSRTVPRSCDASNLTS